MVAARGFLTDKDRVFREGAKFTDESIKSMRTHRERFFKYNFLRGGDSTGREALFRNVNTYKDLKVANKDTFCLSIKAEKESYLPILHDDEGYKAQPIYHC